MKRDFRSRVVFLAVLAALLLLGGRTPVCGGAREKNDLRQIALFYNSYLAEVSRGPKNLKEFTAYIKRDAPKLHKALTDGVYVLVLTKRPASNRVLAYEKKADKGNHTVVMGDNAVKILTTKELKKALKKSE